MITDIDRVYAHLVLVSHKFIFIFVGEITMDVA